MMETPIKKEIVDGLVAELGIKDFHKKSRVSPVVRCKKEN